IGRSAGININYEVVGTGKTITCFTTTPVNYGMTFIVLAPEHEMVKELTTPQQQKEVEEYVAACIKKTDVERQQEGKEKTGVFTGSYVKNQVTGEHVPVWVADFVLASFGTGAVQGCPAHDERDFEFATKYDLPIVRVVEGPDGQKAKFVDPKKETVDQVKLNHGIKRKMINSGPFDGLVFDEGMQKTMDYFVEKGWGKRTVNYKMRDWSVSRQRYWGAPIPIINCPKCGPVLVPDDELPVILPELTDFKPSGDGRSALGRATDWLRVTCPKCGGEAERETDTLDTYLDSSWYMYRYFDPRNQQEIFSSKLAKKWEPIDFYNGADHATAHLLYARFMARFFKKLGLVNEPEPFKQFIFNGKVTAANGANFSKTAGNGIDPLEIIDSGYGADALRTYLMFAAPLELWTRWDSQGVPGTYRFLTRIWNLVQEYLSSETSNATNVDQAAVRYASNQMVKKVTEEIEANRYNTAIAAIMSCLNELYKLKSNDLSRSEAWQYALESLVACVAPFAPHISEELWYQLGHETSIHRDSWPSYDEKYLALDTVAVVVQVNGKVRTTIMAERGAPEAEVVSLALEDPNVDKHLAGKQAKRVIFVPNKLLNLVV
ncbi:MAG TPA: leucine--tRNA ligase, partial [Candidatus Saccharimonadales bacterium]|nr:leucine--tRNA ligase [Candidatus Saccharimonadales bacterium]